MAASCSVGHGAGIGFLKKAGDTIPVQRSPDTRILSPASRTQDMPFTRDVLVIRVKSYHFAGKPILMPKSSEASPQTHES
jgi:hypothetical protein